MIIENVAEILYVSDNPAIPWKLALDEDRSFYFRVADVVLDAVVSYLDSENEKFDGALGLAIQLLANDAERTRLATSAG